MAGLTVDGRIFNELERHDPSGLAREAYERAEAGDETLQDTLYSLAAKELGEEPRPLDSMDEERRERLDDEIDSMVAVERLSKGSLLYGKLSDWHGGTDQVEQGLRSAVDDSDSLWMVHGLGYDWIGKDVLGAESDDNLGLAEDLFLEGATRSEYQETAATARSLKADAVAGLYRARDEARSAVQ